MTALTRVELLHIDGKIERWIRFGCPEREEILDRQRRAFWFAPGRIFAFVRWAGGDYGTLVSRIDILRACNPGEPLTTVPGVSPGAESLLRIAGWPKVETVLGAIDQIERLDIRPEDVCPDHWRHVHNCVGVGETPRAYDRARHRAWLLRRRIDA